MKSLSFKTLEDFSLNQFLLKNGKERILQFGEGNFLRGFVDYFIDILNEKVDFNSKIVVVQPIERGLCDMINEQEGLYTLYLRDIHDGKERVEKRIISSISRCINPYSSPTTYYDIAKNPDLRFIVSNTTEAGIVFDKNVSLDEVMPKNFPAKLTKFLYHRFQLFGKEKGKGFILLPCELIDNNGDNLHLCVDKYIELWNLPNEFKQWIDEENVFCNTLVDRIVTGYPVSEVDTLNQENQYKDNLLNTAEHFGFWVIEGSDSLKKELPFEKADLPVLITKDHKPYKLRKVRILNGAHTSMIHTAFLMGKDTVKECLDDECILKFMSKTLSEEVIPLLTLPIDELNQFKNDVIQRFKNPYIKHFLLPISLNSISKWKARVLPSMKDYYEKYGYLPKHILFSFAAIIAFYEGKKIEDGALIGCRNGVEYKIIDDRQVLDFVLEYCNKCEDSMYIEKFASNTFFWGEDLTKYPEFTEKVVHYYQLIRNHGAKSALIELLEV